MTLKETELLPIQSRHLHHHNNQGSYRKIRSIYQTTFLHPPERYINLKTCIQFYFFFVFSIDAAGATYTKDILSKSVIRSHTCNIRIASLACRPNATSEKIIIASSPEIWRGMWEPLGLITNPPHMRIYSPIGMQKYLISFSATYVENWNFSGTKSN